MILQRRGEDADVVEGLAVDAGILGVDMNEAIGELEKRVDRIHLLPDQMGGIVVEAEGGAGNVGKHPPPDLRARGEILSPRPFVARERHRAVLDADPHAAIFGELDQRPPGLEKPGPVVVDRLRPIAADERVHPPNAELARGPDHLGNMLGRGERLSLVRCEWIGVVAQAADPDSSLGRHGADPFGIGRREAVNRDVRHAGIAALGRRRRPAHQLNALVAGLGRGAEDLLEGELGKNGADKAELHGSYLGRNTSGGAFAPHVWAL